MCLWEREKGEQEYLIKMVWNLVDGNYNKKEKRRRERDRAEHWV